VSALRLLIVPAAGRGSRLSAAVPKLLVPVGGRPMIDRVLERYEGIVDQAIVIVSPDAEASVRTHCAGSAIPVETAVQPHPTGMLDAILAPLADVAARRAASVWITWCDQVAISEATVTGLAAITAGPAAPDLALPTAQVEQPYIHFVRDGNGRIAGVLQRREGDVMPPIGETDSGLFALSRQAYLEHLPVFARDQVPGAGTGERNFLPFVPWMARRGIVRTFPVRDPIESVGINTPEDLALVEAHLHS
jgi:bifunctional N-acetylglucosamine-1-phosphate-uridyltransferase/glucosamine-1-phosphate-acetyltransferase GlmU-like protein